MQPRRPQAPMGYPAPSKRQKRQNRSLEPGCKMRRRGFSGRMPGRPAPLEPGKAHSQDFSDGNPHRTRWTNNLLPLSSQCSCLLAYVSQAVLGGKHLSKQTFVSSCPTHYVLNLACYVCIQARISTVTNSYLCPNVLHNWNEN